MRICHFLSSDTFAGIEQYVDEISNEQSHNHQVIIVTNKSILKKFNNNVSKTHFSSLGRNSPLGLLRLFFLIKEIKLLSASWKSIHSKPFQSVSSSYSEA